MVFEALSLSLEARVEPLSSLPNSPPCFYAAFEDSMKAGLKSSLSKA